MTCAKKWINGVLQGAGGDVVGPSSSTDNAIPRYDGTTGKLIQDSGVLIDDTDALYGDAVDRLLYTFEDVTERDTFFAAHPNLLITDMLICIKDTTPPPTPGVRSLDFSKAINSQYKPLPLP